MTTMKLIEWRPMVKNTLRGFVTVELPNGLVIKDISVLDGKRGLWCSLPAKPVFDSNGKPKLGSNGKGQYASILEWRDRDLQGRFSEALVALLLTEHPRALDE